MQNYKEYIINSIIISIIFTIMFCGGMILTNAWSGGDNLTTQDGDVVTLDKWNSLVNKISNGWNIVQTEITGSTDINITNAQGAQNIPGANISNFKVGNSGKVLVQTSCTTRDGSPYIHTSIDGGTNWKGLGALSTYVKIYGRGNVTGEHLFEGLTPGENINIIFQIINTTTTETLSFKIGSEPAYCPCRFTAISM